MRRIPFACALLPAISFACVAAAQTTASSTLPAALRTHLGAERFDIVTSIRGLPLGVRDELQRMWQSQTLDIAEPGAEYQGTSGASRALPTRRLIAAGCSPDHHCFLYYERAGRAPAWFAALFHWTPTATRFEGGGTAPGGLKTPDDVRKALLSGTLGHTELW